MPPKKFPNLNRLKNNTVETNGGDLKKQFTISKFFAKSTAESKPNKNVTVMIDDSEEGSKKHASEKKISSPFKKRQREENAVPDPKTVKKRCSLIAKQTATSCCFKADGTDSLTDDKEEKLKQIVAKTREKLQEYVAADIDTLHGQPTNNVSAFNFDILKREKASALPDINSPKDETVTQSDAEGEEDKDGDVEIMDSGSSATPTENVLSAFKNKRQTYSVLSSSQKDKPSAPAALKPKTKIKYTQLEQQFVEIKEKYPDAILFVECGYKYRFFGEDAEIAAQVLKIFCHLDHNFMTASIPNHRLMVHVRRLVAAGYKVGVVKQTETAALKAAGSNKNTPFTRQLTALYTKSTLIGEDMELAESEVSQENAMADVTSYLLCVCDNIRDKLSKNQLIGIVAVQPSTGDIMYDCFEDNSSHSELETRLVHIQPVEILLSRDVSEATEKLVTGLQAVSLSSDDRLRIEKQEADKFDPSRALQTVTQFYKPKDMSQDQATKLQEIVNLPQPVLCCLSALIHYLRDFNLDKALYQLDNFTQFSTKSKYMQLNGNTVRNLELFQNATDGQEKGSLYWTLNQTVTKFGARMIRSWLAKPLMCVKEIQARQSAVCDILSGKFPDVQSLKAILARLPDLEKGLCSIYHKKCNPQEFYSVCKALEAVYESFKMHREAVNESKASDKLKGLVSEIPELLCDIEDFSKALSEKEARENDKTKMFFDESQFPAILESKKKISGVIGEINNHRREVRLKTGQPGLEYTTVLGTEFLVEVKNTNIGLVPKDWTKISSTKTVSRFHTPYIVEKYKELNQRRERLLIDCNQAWIQFLDTFSEKYQCYRKAVSHLSTLDCLFSLAVVAQNNGYCKPDLREDKVCIDIKQGCHPVIKTLLAENDQYVPNDTCLSSDGQRVMIITGPNMGGKSSYIKQVATLVIMAQMGSYIPAESATLGVFDAIFTRMGASDEIYKGRSTFMVELSEASEIIAKATSKSLVILDELGRGTSTHDGVAIAQATLNFFINQPRSLTLFVTHYPELAEFEDRYPEVVGNFHMSFFVSDDMEDDSETVTFLYQLVAGMAARSYGLNVASLANVPSSILCLATDKSRSLEERVAKRRKKIEAFKKLCAANAVSVHDIKDLINDLE